jgi:uncharacterized iron-regulated protein
MTQIAPSSPQPLLSFRRAIAAAAFGIALIGACAAPGPGDESAVTNLRSGRDMAPADLLAAVRRADIVLLGERHDNPAHYARRAELLAELKGSGAAVIAEQLQAGRTVQAGAVGDALLPALEQAGFDARGWGWPLQQPLFQAIEAAGLPLQGGNLPLTEARRIAREGESAWPPALAALLRRAPLSPQGQAALDDELLQGHCGQLPAARLPAMRAAQRARDAAMAQALLAAHAAGARPAVLVAGNGHVRNDYGVGQLLAALAPTLSVLSVEFAESGAAPDAPDDAAAGAVTSHRWVTPPASRDDPCIELRARPAMFSASAPTSAPR